MEVALDASVCHTTSDSVPFLQQGTNRVFHEDVNAFVNPTFLQRPDDFQSGSVADVSEAREGVTAKVSLIDEVLWGAVKHSAPLLQFSNTVGRFLCMELSHAPIGQPFASFHGVVEVHLPTVTRIGVL